VTVDVLHVLATNQRRGAETFGHDLHRALCERGLQSEICCLESARVGRSLPVRALADRRFSVGGAKALRREAALARVVVAHGSNTLLACGLGLAGLGVPFVYVNIGDPRVWAATRGKRLRTRWLLGRAAAVASISPGARDVLLDHYRLDPARVHVIPNGRHPDRLHPASAGERAAARRELELPLDADVVAVIGALGREKRVDVAIAAVAQLPQITLVVAGDGPERATLDAMADRSAPGRVVFLGATDGPADVLAAADVLALSSDSEGVPGVLIEAGFAGLPVVATDVGWVRDVVRPGKTGLLVPPNRPDLLAAAIADALAQRADMGAAGRAHCLAQFDMRRVTESWQHLIGEVSGASVSPGRNRHSVA
jgi:glycosyltransferase involved in cell wall biosynthesis